MEEVRQLLETAGMEYMGAQEAYTDEALSETTDRVLICAREHGK